MTLARISITLPPELVKAADRRAAELDRSRSWVIAEALRLGLGAVAPVARVRETAQEAARPPYAAAGLGSYRRAQLEADLALTPEERVREAELTLRAAELRGRGWRGERLLMFDRYEDYLAWQRSAELTPP